jgi:hypothetical protein
MGIEPASCRRPSLFLAVWKARRSAVSVTRLAHPATTSSARAAIGQPQEVGPLGVLGSAGTFGLGQHRSGSTWSANRAMKASRAALVRSDLSAVAAQEVATAALARSERCSGVRGRGDVMAGHLQADGIESRSHPDVPQAGGAGSGAGVERATTCVFDRPHSPGQAGVGRAALTPSAVSERTGHHRKPICGPGQEYSVLRHKGMSHP